VLAGEVKDSLLLDAIPWSLGIATGDGVCTRLVERNTNLPTKRSEVFTTARDSQDSVQIRLYQGERDEAEANTCLGTFVLSGLPPAPGGVPQIEVGIDIDANCTVVVSARELATGKKQSMVVDADSARFIDEVDPHARLVSAGG
jgi:molecular chaperone DnaK